MSGTQTVSLLGVLALAAGPLSADVVKVTPDELAACHEWVAAHFEAGPAGLPFSFVFGGRSSGELLPGWQAERDTVDLDALRTQTALTYRDPQTGLVVRCVAVQYKDFPTVEWTVYLRNDGTADTPILQDIRALDVGLSRGESGEFVLHHNVGSPCRADDYQPLTTVLEPGKSLHIGAAGGRSTNSDLSYFSLEAPGEQGLIVAIGWPGQWASEWVRDDAGGLHVVAGQELCHLKLLPGEEIRTPLVALQHWRGDWLRAQNVWRRWFIAHGIHRPGGKLPPIQWCGANEVETNMMVGATEENVKRCVDAYLAHGWQPDFWWMDAGWYPCNGDWTCTGTWEADPARFPNGFRAVTDYLHQRGIRSILWFEPERVRAGTRLATEHPEWILPGDGDGLLDLGNPEAWNWLVEHVSRLIDEYGIDIYRQDFNMDPLWHWRAHDAEDRQGVTENRYVVALLAYWDELLRRHPGLLYDNCASGGRRNDLESMRRGVPYTKSDYADDPVGVQGETYGISMWIPYFAATWGTSDDPYLCRSRIAPVIGICYDSRIPDHLAQLPQRLAEWREVTPNYWGDFWPLTPYSLASDAWIAWQFGRPDAGEGVVQVFRRTECEEGSIRLKLRGLDPEATYTVRDIDAAAPQDIRGSVLMEEGLTVAVPTQPGAAIVTYRRL